jgi:lipopolysaccharide transport system ATP-binding protein
VSKDLIIKIENLGKEYRIGSKPAEKYLTLRDAVSHGVKSVGERLLHPKISSKKNLPDSFWALRNISFNVERGEVIGVIGSNGAGKSTLLKLLSRITYPTEGSITLSGRVASLLEVGTGFHPELTGRENIFLNGAILGMSRIEICKRFDEIVDFSEIEQFLDTPVKRYSSGMYVRLAFAVAAHLEPEILVVDEVLAVGDIAFQKKCLGKMQDVSSQDGRTVFFVSHSIGAVKKLCTSAIYLKSGCIGAIGATSTVSESYLNQSYSPIPKKVFPLSIDKKAQVSQVRLLNSLNFETSEFQCGSQVTVEIMLLVHRRVRGCHLACIVTTNEGYHLFSTADTDQNEKLFDERLPGKYCATVNLPTSLLNTGVYHIAVGLGVPGIELIDRQDAVSFTLYETADFGSLKEGSRREGFLLCQIPWTYS